MFSISENCARQYWKDYPLNASEKIAIIGFSNIGQNILGLGLLTNIIDPNQHFEYHIYGDGSEYMRTHLRLNEMLPDEIFFCDDGNYDLYELMKRYSNISSADFLFVIKRLAEKQVPFKTITELEHIRWCKYYYLNNWTYGEKRDDSKRIQNCLIPISELSKAEIDKDIETIISKL